MPAKKDPADLFYIDESALSVTDEEECQNLMDCEVPPEQVADPVFRAKYVKFLEANKEDTDAE